MPQHPHNPQPPYQYGQPPRYVPPKRRKKGHPVLLTLGIVAAIVVGLALIGSVLAGGGDPDTATTPTAVPTSSGTSPEPVAKEKPAPKPKTPGLGDAVKDGDFTFAVTKIEDTGKTELGDDTFGTVKAQGRFVYVHLTVLNHGKEPSAFFGDDQYVYDADGRKFSANSEAAIFLPETQAFIEEINPGNKLTGIVVFDLPKGATVERVELHDLSAFSDGVTVSVREKTSGGGSARDHGTDPFQQPYVQALAASNLAAARALILDTAPTAPLVCAATEDSRPVDCRTGQPLDYRAGGWWR